MSDIKTETQIEKDFFRFVKASSLKDLLAGKIYRKGMRPRDAKTEDAVVGFQTGRNGQFQSGYVFLNVFVPMQQPKSMTNTVRDIKRVETIESAIIKIFEEEFDDPHYNIEIESTPFAEEIEDIEQTRINTQIHYIRTTF